MEFPHGVLGSWAPSRLPPWGPGLDSHRRVPHTETGDTEIVVKTRVHAQPVSRGNSGPLRIHYPVKRTSLESKQASSCRLQVINNSTRNGCGSRIDRRRVRDEVGWNMPSQTENFVRTLGARDLRPATATHRPAESWCRRPYHYHSCSCSLGTANLGMVDTKSLRST